jgi:hypothetical protein
LFLIALAALSIHYIPHILSFFVLFDGM